MRHRPNALPHRLDPQKITRPHKALRPSAPHTKGQRPAGRLVLTLPITQDERHALDNLRAALNLDSDANLIRCALYKLADHYDHSTPATLFKVRHNG